MLGYRLKPPSGTTSDETFRSWSMRFSRSTILLTGRLTTLTAVSKRILSRGEMTSIIGSSVMCAETGGSTSPRIASPSSRSTDATCPSMIDSARDCR
jgi:hypothetical protein